MILETTLMEISREKMKKIAYIITLPDLGGAQSHLYEVMINISKYGYEPILITGRQGWLTETLRGKYIEVHIVPELVREISPIKDCMAVEHIQRILRQEQPVLVHCHSSKAGIIGRIAAHRCQMPVVFTAHGWAFTDGVMPIKRKLYAAIERIVGYWTDKIVCVSEYDHRLGVRYLSNHKGKMRMIHNCIPDMPELVRDWQNKPVGDEINVIVVARFSPPKKNIHILRALRTMLDAGMEIKVTFVGDGPQLEMAKAEARRLKLENKAVFLGSRTDVPKLLPEFDLFLLLSNWEGFPISILEAMRAGLPVIASDVGGVNEAVSEKTGCILKNDDELPKVIRMFARNKKMFVELGINARNVYLNNFTSQVMLTQINEVYSEVCSGR